VNSACHPNLRPLKLLCLSVSLSSLSQEKQNKEIVDIYIVFRFTNDINILFFMSIYVQGTIKILHTFILNGKYLFVRGELIQRNNVFPVEDL